MSTTNGVSILTIIIDANVLWWLLGIAIWLLLGVIGLLAGNAATRNKKWDMWKTVVPLGAITFVIGVGYLIFEDW